MSELRAPDPTLKALGHRFVTVVEDDVVLEAHDEDCAHAWGPHLMAQSVAYQAAPCRECFPDAPKPGERPCTCLVGPPIYRGVLHYHPDDDLSWQVSS